MTNTRGIRTIGDKKQHTMKKTVAMFPQIINNTELRSDKNGKRDNDYMLKKKQKKNNNKKHRNIKEPC